METNPQTADFPPALQRDELFIRPANRIVIMAIAAYAAAMVLIFLGLDQLGRLGGPHIVSPLETLRRVLLVIGALPVAYIWLRRLTTTLRVGRDEITLRSGLMTRDFGRVQIDKITNCAYHRPSLALMLGLVTLKIESSGATDSLPGMVIRYLSMRDGNAVMRRIRQEKDAHAEGRPPSDTPLRPS